MLVSAAAKSLERRAQNERSINSLIVAHFIMPQNTAELRHMYEAATGVPWSDEEGARWLMARYDDLDIYFKQLRLAKQSHVTLSDKLSWLSQQYCYICQPDGPIHVLPIRIKPESYQALDGLNKAAFKRAVAERFANYDFNSFKNRPICLTLLFVCSRTRKVRDLDNMAKLLVDSLKDVLLGDDRFIDHLSMIRLTHETEEEFVYVRISTSGLNDHSNVAAPIMRHSWAGMRQLRIEDYLKTAA
ncbi:MAG TPA: RusA family crossover junction endodeoxyribonuclease [Chthoniobacterales bacterium]|jgi:Holliday junction resolvase RusA-like endonuclease